MILIFYFVAHWEKNTTEPKLVILLKSVFSACIPKLFFFYISNKSFKCFFFVKSWTGIYNYLFNFLYTQRIFDCIRFKKPPNIIADILIPKPNTFWNEAFKFQDIIYLLREHYQKIFLNINSIKYSYNNNYHHRS